MTKDVCNTLDKVDIPLSTSIDSLFDALNVLYQVAVRVVPADRKKWIFQYAIRGYNNFQIVRDFLTRRYIQFTFSTTIEGEYEIILDLSSLFRYVHKEINGV